MRKIVGVFFAAALLAMASQSGAITVGGTTIVPIGVPEVVSVTFLASNGGTSTGTYDGLVQIDVTGTGELLASRLNDAFFVFTDGAHTPTTPFNNGRFYQLSVDTTPLVGSPGFPTPGIHNAVHHIVYNIDAGSEVSPTYVPAYRPATPTRL